MTGYIQTLNLLNYRNTLWVIIIFETIMLDQGDIMIFIPYSGFPALTLLRGSRKPKYFVPPRICDANDYGAK